MIGINADNRKGRRGGQVSELHSKLLQLRLETRALAGEQQTGVSEPAAARGAAETKALAEATENLWRVLDELYGKANFNPNQARVPRGNPDGGQWTDTAEGESGRVRQESRRSERVTSEPSRFAFSFLERMNEQGYQWVYNVLLAAGHHLVPRATIRNLGIPADTAKVLGDTTGPLLPPHHGWDEAHAKYNAEAEKEITKFAQARGKLPSQLTPDDGRDLMKEFWHSKNPVIRQFNLNIFRTEVIRQIGRRGRRR